MLQLTEEEMGGLRASILPLEQCIEQIYVLGDVRDPRPLLGEDSVVLRTVGPDFEGYEKFQPSYLDVRKGKFVKTEFAEFVEALLGYESDPSIGHVLDMYLEASDILFQRYVVDVRHKGHPMHQEALQKIDQALAFVRTKMEHLRLPYDRVKWVAERKYGAMLWTIKNRGKRDKDIENAVCLELLLDGAKVRK